MSGLVHVVHCVDTEGPLGGDARRLPDGSPEFMDNWGEIMESLAELTGPFRHGHRDSVGGPYVFNWFILDFTGFRTNPKCRVAEYHDTYDHLASLPTELDGIYWHYHAPPAGGVGDAWAESWLESNEHNTILARRLLERGDFPAAFRAGGTIEDEAASAWLEEAVLIDFSNRVSERSTGTGGLRSFDWYGSPRRWGSYHPAHGDLTSEGSMRRYVYRSIDLRSRYNELSVDHVAACFREVAETGEPRVLSFFSHDNRDMRDETYHAHELLDRVARQVGVGWVSATAVQAHRAYHGLSASPIQIDVEVASDGVRIETDAPPFQLTPFTALELGDGRFVRVYPRPEAPCAWRLPVEPERFVRVGSAVTSVDGSTTVAIENGGA